MDTKREILKPAKFFHCLASALLLQTPLLAAVPTVVPADAPWDAGAGFEFQDQPKKTRRAVSGIACALNAKQENICLFAFDEGVEARFARIGAGRVTPLPGGVTLGKPGTELDAEGAATDGAYFYVTGSHAVKRKDTICTAPPNSRHVIRFKRDAGSGLALYTQQDAKRPDGYQDSERLLSIVMAQPLLAKYQPASTCLGAGGLDVEGLAVRSGRLYFGLRGPGGEGKAFILSVDAAHFFSGEDAQAAVATVTVGQKRGIRDMVATGDGILLLVGPDDVEANKDAGWVILHWDGSAQAAQAKELAALDLSRIALRDCDKESKPEAMTILRAEPKHYELLILSDGMCDGGAMRFNVAR